MKNKGFTLVELLGTMIILVLILIITFPTIINQLKNANASIDEATAVLIDNSVDIYINEHPERYELIDQYVYCIQLQTLVDEGLLFENLKYSNGNKIDLNQYAQVNVLANKQYEIELVNNCAEVREEIAIVKVSGNATKWTNKDVTLNISTNKPVTEVAGYSFDNGTTWQTSPSKAFSTNQTVTMKVKDLAGQISESKTVVIDKIDKVAPVINVAENINNFTITINSKDYVTTPWVTESDLIALGYTTTGTKIEKKTQYGYEKVATWAGTYTGNATTTYYKESDGYANQTAKSWSAWSTTVPSNNYYKTQPGTETVTYTTAVGGQSGIGTYSYSTAGSIDPLVQEISFGESRTVTEIDTDVDSSYSDWSGTVSPSLTFYCYNGSWSSLWTSGSTDDDQGNFMWTGSKTCTKVKVKSNGYSGRDRTFVHHITVTSKGTKAVTEYSYVTAWNTATYSTSCAGNSGDKKCTSQKIYQAALTWGNPTGWKDFTPYSQTPDTRPLTREMYRHYNDESYIIPTGSATDNVSTDLAVVSSGNIIPTVAGTYKVTYATTDEAGNKTTLVMTVNVV